MGQNMTTEQLESLIANLEKQGLLEAPRTLESRVMEQIAQKQTLQKNQPYWKWQRFFYQLKIGAATAAALVLLFLPVGHGSYERSSYGQAKQILAQKEEKMGFLDYVEQGADILTQGVIDVSDYVAKGIMEVVRYDK